MKFLVIVESTDNDNSLVSSRRAEIEVASQDINGLAIAIANLAKDAMVCVLQDTLDVLQEEKKEHDAKSTEPFKTTIEWNEEVKSKRKYGY